MHRLHEDAIITAAAAAAAAASSMHLSVNYHHVHSFVGRCAHSSGASPDHIGRLRLGRGRLGLINCKMAGRQVGDLYSPNQLLTPHWISSPGHKGTTVVRKTEL